MTPHNFAMPWLTKAMRIFPQTMGIVFPVMGWLDKVMARNEKVTGCFAGFFSGTCSGLVPAVKSYRGLFRGASANQHNFYVKIGTLAMSIVPNKNVEQFEKSCRETGRLRCLEAVMKQLFGGKFAGQRCGGGVCSSP